MFLELIPWQIELSCQNKWLFSGVSEKLGVQISLTKRRSHDWTNTVKLTSITSLVPYHLPTLVNYSAPLNTSEVFLSLQGPSASSQLFKMSWQSPHFRECIRLVNPLSWHVPKALLFLGHQDTHATETPGLLPFQIRWPAKKVIWDSHMVWLHRMGNSASATLMLLKCILDNRGSCVNDEIAPYQPSECLYILESEFNFPFQ